jgi:hypothetical protein
MPLREEDFQPEPQNLLAPGALRVYIQAMMRRFLLLGSLALALVPAAGAQLLSVYGTFSDTQFSNVQSSVPPTNTGTYQTTSFWGAGVGGGVTFGVLPVGPVHIGLDFRGSTKPGASGGDTAFGGLRIGLKLPVIRIKPYVQGSGGYVVTRTAAPASSSNTSGTITNQYAGYEIFGGVDYPIVHFIDFRVIEIGGGQAYTIDTSTYAINHISLFSINTGVVVHF